MSTAEKGSPKLTLAKARAEHARLEAEIAEHDRRYHGLDAPIISDAEYDELRRRYAALEEAFPQLAGANSLNRKVGAAPSEKFAKARHRVPMLSLGNIFADEEVEEFSRPRAPLSRHGRERPARIRRRAEDRRALLQPALRERRARPGGDARRRLRGRGRHRQRAHGASDPEAARRRAQGLRGARRSLYAPCRLRRAQRAPGRRRQAGVRQPAELRRRFAAPARSAHHRRAAACLFRLLLGRGQRAVRHDPVRRHRGHAPLRPADQFL